MKAALDESRRHGKNKQSVETVFIVCGSGFVVFGLAWYFTWTIFIHSTMSMYGSDPLSLEPTIPPDEERRMKVAQVWARRFRWGTWLFLSLTAVAALWLGVVEDAFGMMNHEGPHGR